MEPGATYQYDSSPTGDGDVQFLDLTNGAGGEGEDSYDEEDEPTQRPGTSSSSIKGGKYDSTAPPGKVVETGQEHTGRWTKEEHEAFLTALRTYGKEWKKVAAKVKTRTVVQTRTHAQKYFQKLQKVVGSGEKDVSNVEMGVASEARRAASLQKKKQRLAASATKVARQNSVTSAAHLISNLSERPPATAYETLPSAFSKPQLPIVGHKSSLFPASHGFSTFSSSTAAASSSAEAEYAFSSTGFAKTTVSKAAAFPMKIVAPEHDLAMKLGKFPEPSPAACGKRKLAEIAAARMLAGVAGLGQGGRDKPLMTSAMDDGTATPPPEEEDAKADMKELPAPPISLGKNIDSLLNRKPLGLSLQIVNPETLGISYESQRRRKGGQRSPQTPWEDQLLALVRYVLCEDGKLLLNYCPLFC
jgi:SHAQKYF class myb-like DNA-binding protein